MSSDILPFKTQRLLLRRFHEKDLPAFTDYRSDPAVARYQGWNHFTLRDAQIFFQGQRDLPWAKPDSWLQIACTRLDTDELIGDCGLHFLSEQGGMEIGFTVAPRFQGKGYAREAVQALCHQLFAKTGCQRIQAVTDARNLASLRLLERVGFQKLGHEPEKTIFKGEPCEEWTLVLTPNLLDSL